MTKSIQLDHDTWKEHSTLIMIGVGKAAVAILTATFLFGGTDFEIFINNTWTKINEGFYSGCVPLLQNADRKFG